MVIDRLTVNCSLIISIHCIDDGFFKNNILNNYLKILLIIDKKIKIMLKKSYMTTFDYITTDIRLCRYIEFRLLQY